MRLGYTGFFIILAGCSSQEITQPAEYSQRIYTTEKPAGKDTTLTWYNYERSGAAYVAEAYRHVLAKRNTTKLVDHAPEPSLINPDDPASITENISAESYTVYETRRWERFCNAGKMDSKDWDFIAQKGRKNIPEQLKNICVSPAYTRQEYIDAWKASCESKIPTDSQKVIRNNTIAPRKICEA